VTHCTRPSYAVYRLVSGAHTVSGYPIFSSLFSPPAIEQSLAFHDRISLDLDQPVGVDEAHDLHDRVCGPDATKELAVDRRYSFPILYSGQQNSGAGHIGKLAAQSFNR